MSVTMLDGSNPFNNVVFRNSDGTPIPCSDQASKILLNSGDYSQEPIVRTSVRDFQNANNSLKNKRKKEDLS